MRTSFIERIGLQTPIMLAPLGGGPCTPELVAAVSAAGGFGWLAGAYLTPAQIRSESERIRALTDQPFGINLFCGGWSRPSRRDAPAMMALLGEAHAELGLAAPVMPSVGLDPYPAQLEAVMDVAPAMFSCTFGMPRREDVARLQAAGIAVAGTATTVREARLLQAAGFDALFAQGEEAGGHRGAFAGAFEASMVPTLKLVRDIAAASPLPIIAAGGLMDGADIARVLDAGACAAALGTAFLACPESGASPAYKAALTSAGKDDTVMTRAFSGRPARGLKNRFIRAVEAGEIDVPPYPLQNALTRPLRAAAAAGGQADYLSLWAGRGVGRLRQLPAAALMAALVEEIEAARSSTAWAQQA